MAASPLGLLRAFVDKQRAKRIHAPPSSEQLLNDAKIVIAYASVLGVETPAEFMNSLGKIDIAASAGPLSFGDMQSLNLIVSKVLKLIFPKTIDDARSYYAASASRSKFVPILVNIFALYLIVVVISLTTDFNIANSTLTDLSKVDLVSYLGVLQDTYDLQHPKKNSDPQRGTTNASGDNSDVTQKLRENVKSLRSTDAAANAAAAKLGPIVQLVQSNSLNWCLVFFGSILSCNTSVAEKPRQEDKPSVVPQVAGADHGVSSDNTSQNPSIGQIATLQAGSSGGTGASPAGGSSAAGPTDPIVSENLEKLNRLQSYGLSLGLSLADATVLTSFYLIQSEGGVVVMVLGSLILPLLYGLLGASVFLMRQFFGDALKSAQKDMTLGRVLLRLGLGGVAGLAIGWFWTPGTSREVSGVTTLATTPFALAFLAGFSIELLFSILDRIILAITPGDGTTQSERPPSLLPSTTRS